MRVPLSITQKLLLFVLPLVCLPAAVVGFFSYNDSIESVTRLSQEQQLMQAKSVAAQIDHIFQTCMTDLKIICGLPAMEDYVHDINITQKEETAIIRTRVEKILKEYITHSSYYSQIRVIDGNGETIVGVSGSETGECPVAEQKPHFSNMYSENKDHIHVSEIVFYSSSPCFVLYFSKDLFNSRKEHFGKVVIDLYYNKIIDLVRSVEIGEAGYAFMVDNRGRSVAHPQFRPYEYNLSKYADPSLREFVVNMIAGETGWKIYNYLGEKAAAHTSIPSIGWSVAVCIPIEEFKREANLLRKRTMEAVILTVLAAILGVIVLSYNLLKPVKRLVAATEQIARGDLNQEIPVRSGDELGILTRSFNRMIRNLREIQAELVRSEKLISMGKLSAGVAHEIRNPLNAMKGAIVYLSRRRPHDPLVQEYTQLLQEEVNRLNQFVTEFLHFAKQSVPDPVPVNVSELLENTLFLFNERFKEKAITVEKNFDDSLPLIPIDTYQMEQVIINLLMNALDAMSKDGKLEVATRLRMAAEKTIPRATAVIFIKDDGVGISEKEMNHIFDPFFSTKENGTGLGLPISVGIIENHGGLLLIKSRKDEGTTAVIELPVHNYRVQQGKQNAKKNPDC